MVRITFIFLAIIVILTTSCNSTKRVPANDALYLGAATKVEGDGLSSAQRKDIRSNMQSLTKPKPNSRILGIPFKLHFYNLGGIFKKWGEPPVLLSQVSIDNNVKILQNSLENHGYFRAVVSGDTVVKKKKGTAVYTAKPGTQYTIREVFVQQDSTRLQQAINNIKGVSVLRPGDAFNLPEIKAERLRIDTRLKDSGFYFFSPDYILVDTDTTIGDHKVNLYVNTKPETPQEARQQYRISNIYIYANYSLNSAETDTNQAHARLYRGYYVVDSSHLYNPRLFAHAMQFYPGDLYNRRYHNNTLSRLINLGIFKFVKNRFEPSSDSTLDAYYYLTPQQKKSLRVEVGATNKSNNMTGSEIVLGFTNRNTFKGGEILKIDASVGSEVTVSGQFRGYNTFRIGAEANFAFPRFVTPFFTVNPRGGFVPRTNIQIGYDILTRQKLYTLTSFRGGFGYIWKESVKKEHTFYPISIQYVQPSKITQIYLDSLLKNPTLGKAVDTQFIFGGNYNYQYNSLIRREAQNGVYFNGLLDLSGNLLGLFTGGNVKKGDETARIFGAPFSQFVKIESDFRIYRKISKSNLWANRLIIGLGFPYGNSYSLPFIKQYFIGGNNSVRAFRSRSIGPGTYFPTNYGSDGFVPDQSGDIKLEINSELRIKLMNIVYGALFVDAGNVWLYNEDTLKPGGKFSKDFLKELAVGAGVGIRFDINILVLRLDVAFPLRKPFLENQERWVINQIKLNKAAWRKENIVWNLAIGYPF